MSEVRKILGVVVIGRNEGERLKRSLQSIDLQRHPVVYVDSGSTDGSISHASAVGCDVVELDLGTPFTAARARNEGWRRLASRHPDIEYVQFIDGDCELDPGWLDVALAELDSEPTLAVVCGRRRERFPEASIYNRLIDMEWNTPIGGANACGGDALIRLAALVRVGGYDPTFAAGEEPDLCLRMRREGWKIRRIDAEMTLHDAAMTRFGQWWTRTKRSGSAYAQGAWTHGRGPERYKVRDCARIWFWAGLLPAAAILCAIPTYGLSLGLLGAGYGILLVKVTRYRRSQGDSMGDALVYSAFALLGKFPQLLGQIAFLRHRQSRLIEYKF